MVEHIPESSVQTNPDCLQGDDGIDSECHISRISRAGDIIGLPPWGQWELAHCGVAHPAW